MTIYEQMDIVFEVVKQLLNEQSHPRFILYPAATVLLDLTANEVCIEKVADMMFNAGMYEFIL